jgi:hypothetical protein
MLKARGGVSAHMCCVLKIIIILAPLITPKPLSYDTKIPGLALLQQQLQNQLYTFKY